MRVPCATYRVQFNRAFQFKHALGLLPYLRALGITDLYASPIFKARKGSMHGYDVVDPSRLNPELGSEQDFDALVRKLREFDMGLMLDIVPNHMAATPENPWWMDVLENNSASAFSAFFDVEWGTRNPGVQDKIFLPILGELYGAALEEKKLQLSLEQGGFRVKYYSVRLPLDPSTYGEILSYRLTEFLQQVKGNHPGREEFGRVLELAERLPARTVTEWEAMETRRHDVPELKKRLWAVYTGYQQVHEFINENVRIFNGTKGDASSFDLLDDLLNKQPYQLTYWKVAREKINYRRFFDVSDLIGVRAQDPQVFEGTHQLTLQLLREGKVTALRVDHIDGLYDPLAYLAQLQARASRETGDSVYVVVEKILSDEETLPQEWPVAGTTGYDFLGVTNNLFILPEGLENLQLFYNRYCGMDQAFPDIAYSQKKRILLDLFAGEIATLGVQLSRLAEKDRYARDLSPAEMQLALIEVTASLPVYRTYTRDGVASGSDRVFIERAFADARIRNPKITAGCFQFLERVLFFRLQNDEDAQRFIMRWQQLTGPVMAKGVEDTTLYQFNRLVSMNDVGGSPYATSAGYFHSFNRLRREHWPDTMNATSTHDTKRSEDVRSRINVLSEMPGDWQKNINRWTRWNRDRKEKVDGSPVPDSNDEYLIYQTLVGAWPLHREEEEKFHLRLKNYMIKAVREAKRHSSWLAPNLPYENALVRFVDAILLEDDSNDSNRFLQQFRGFQKRVAYYGAINSLAQTLLKICSPGVPDFYQGTTIWDFSLVDPDNRRSPEQPDRIGIAEQMPAWDIPGLLKCWFDGRVKAYAIHKALRFRKDHAELFRRGEYIPLEGRGRAAEHTIAFVRRLGDEWALVVVPRFVARFSALEKMPLGRKAWGDAALTLEDGAPQSWVSAITGEHLSGAANVLSVADVFSSFPVALLHPAS